MTHASFDSDISAVIYMFFVPKLCYFKDAKLDGNTGAVISLLRQVTWGTSWCLFLFLLHVG